MALDGDEIDGDDELHMFGVPPSLWVTGVYIPRKARNDAF